MNQKRIETPSDLRATAVSQIVRANCMAPDCAFNQLAFQGAGVGMSVNEQQEAVRLHVQLSGHRVYVHDERGIIVAPAE